MKTSEFLTALRAAPQNQLVFVNANEQTIHSGYHLTELKAASFDTVDCGGQINQWQETIAQLWAPTGAEGEAMTSAKFLKIFDKVHGMVSLNFEAEIRFEYGDENFFPSVYYVRSVAHDQGTTHVLLEPPATTCKARDRRECCNVEAPTDHCCAAA